MDLNGDGRASVVLFLAFVNESIRPCNVRFMPYLFLFSIISNSEGIWTGRYDVELADRENFTPMGFNEWRDEWGFE